MPGPRLTLYDIRSLRARIHALMSYSVTASPATPLRTAIYLRISRDFTGEALGVDRHGQDCHALANDLGWTVAETYTDNDTSATTGRPRPAYTRMLADIQAGLIDAIIVWSPDRLYRKLADLEQLIPIIEDHNIDVRAVKAGHLDLSTAYGRMIARVLGAIMTGEGEIRVERWKRSWRQGRERGAPAKTGSRLFGYTRDGQLLDTEAAIARRMATDIIAGIPILTIARQLEAQGITTTRGTVWRPGTVRQYLANPRIAGWSTLHGQVVAEGTWTPILDRDTWETVRALLTSRARGPVLRVSLLNGLLHCGKCGHRMITSGSRGQRTYRCPNRPGMPGCGSVSAYAAPVEDVVEAYAQRRLASPKVRAALERLATVGAPKVLADIAAVEARIVELEHQLDEPGTQRVATIMRAIDRAVDKLDGLQAQLETATPVRLPDGVGDWPTDLERRRRLVDLVVERVNLAPSYRGARAFNPERVDVVRRDLG